MYFIILALLVVLGFISCIHCDLPNTLLNPHCAYTNQKIYCHDTNRILALDISEQQLWNNQWQKLDDNNFLQEQTQYSSFLSVPDGLLIQQGGMNPGNTTLVNQTIIYEANTNMWKKGSSFGDPVTGVNRQIFASAAVYVPKLEAITFYGGHEKNWVNVTNVNGTTVLVNNFPNGNQTNRGYDTLTLYNPKTNTWSQFPHQINLPLNFYHPSLQTATFHPSSGKIFYLGGVYFSAAAGSQIPNSFASGLSFNTNTGVWFNETYGGDIPSQRLDHTATLMPNSQDDILIYGGGFPTNEALPDYCFSLNLKTMRWTIHNLQPILGVSAPRTKHAAILINTVLFILFGSDADGNSLNDIIRLDVQNVSSLSFLTELSNAASQNNSISPGAIAGIVIGTVIAAIFSLVSVLLFFLKRISITGKLTKEQSMPDVAYIDNEVVVIQDLNSTNKLEREHREVPSFYTPQLSSSTKIEEIDIFVHDEDEDLVTCITDRQGLE